MAKKESLLYKKIFLSNLYLKWYFIEKKNVSKLKVQTRFAFELWTVRQFQRLVSFSKWTVSVLLASLSNWYACFCLFIMVTFLAPLRYVQLLQHLLSETCEGRLSWVLDCFTSILFGREARPVLHEIWPVFKISSGNFFFTTEIVLSCALCVSSNFLSSFLTSELCTLQKVV